jgi:PAS domain S-box-containing protein
MEHGDDDVCLSIGRSGVTIAAETRPAPIRVLLVEDNPDDVLLCQAAIRRSNLLCHVETASTLREAVHWLTVDHADVALVDLALPDAADFEAITVLAKAFFQLPIVVLTGLPGEHNAARALQSGAEDYLVKGADQDSLARCVRYAIERKRGELDRLARGVAEAATKRAERTTRKAERTTREVERNYRQLFDGNPYPVYVFDRNSMAILEVNDAAAAYYGYPRDELLTLNITDLALAEDVAALTVAVGAAVTVERWGPLRQVKKDGTVVEVNMTSHALTFDGRDARCMAIEDITEREHLEQRLHQSRRLESLGMLAGGVAHDFNNLLGIIIGYTTMCAQDVEAAAFTDPGLQALHQDLGQILQAGDRATNLTHQLLSFASAETPRTQVIDLNAMVTGLEQLLRRTIGADIEMRIRLADEPWLINADPGQIEQILLNLVINARDAMPSGGTLSIETDTVDIDETYVAYHAGINTGRYMRLRVTDTGTGMSAATIERAFEPFFTTKPKGQGTGLGLATIYGIVIKAGGHVHITSEPFVGTTFTTLLPQTRETAVSGPNPEPLASTGWTTVQATVLLAEDEDGLRLLTERILTRRGFTVLSAGTGPEAIALATHHVGDIDVLLTDVIMPHMSGHDLATHLHTLRPTLPVVYMSGYAQPLLLSRGTLPEGIYPLTKPVTEQQILRAIHDVLAPRAGAVGVRAAAG